MKEAFLRTADYYLRIESIQRYNDHIRRQTFTNIHGIEFAFDKGYPSLNSYRNSVTQPCLATKYMRV